MIRKPSQFMIHFPEINIFPLISTYFETGCSFWNIFLSNQFLSYEDFDIWTIASDYIVFPYRKCSNSGVLGRAKLFKKPVIVSDAGGLKDQIFPEDFIFNNDTELRDIIENIDINYQSLNSE